MHGVAGIVQVAVQHPRLRGVLAQGAAVADATGRARALGRLQAAADLPILESGAALAHQVAGHGRVLGPLLLVAAVLLGAAAVPPLAEEPAGPRHELERLAHVDAQVADAPLHGRVRKVVLVREVVEHAAAHALGAAGRRHPVGVRPRPRLRRRVRVRPAALGVVVERGLEHVDGHLHADAHGAHARVLHLVQPARRAQDAPLVQAVRVHDAVLALAHRRAVGSARAAGLVELLAHVRAELALVLLEALGQRLGAAQLLQRHAHERKVPTAGAAPVWKLAVDADAPRVLDPVAAAADEHPQVHGALVRLHRARPVLGVEQAARDVGLQAERRLVRREPRGVLVVVVALAEAAACRGSGGCQGPGRPVLHERERRQGGPVPRERGAPRRVVRGRADVLVAKVGARGVEQRGVGLGHEHEPVRRRHRGARAQRGRDLPADAAQAQLGGDAVEDVARRRCVAAGAERLLDGGDDRRGLERVKGGRAERRVAEVVVVAERAAEARRGAEEQVLHDRVHGGLDQHGRQQRRPVGVGRRHHGRGDVVAVVAMVQGGPKVAGGAPLVGDAAREHGAVEELAEPLEHGALAGVRVGAAALVHVLRQERERERDASGRAVAIGVRRRPPRVEPPGLGVAVRLEAVPPRVGIHLVEAPATPGGEVAPGEEVG